MFSREYAAETDGATRVLIAAPAGPRWFDELEQRLARESQWELERVHDAAAAERKLAETDCDVLLAPVALLKAFPEPQGAAPLRSRSCARVALIDEEPPGIALEVLMGGAVDALYATDVEAAPERLRRAIQHARRRRALLRAETELERYRRFFVDGPVIVFRWRAQPGWPVEIVSPNVAALFGVSAEDFLSGRAPYASSVHPDDLERVAREVETHSASGATSFDQEYRIVRPDGEMRWLYDHTVVVRDRAGVPTHFEGYVFDVTALERERRTRAEAERKLFQAQKLEGLGLLAGGVAHDFNNLLTTILGEASIALQALDAESPEHAATQNILGAARSAAALTRQMLAYAGRADADAENVDLALLVRELARLLEGSLPKKARLELSLPSAPALVHADVSQMQQVVTNLAINAAEACGERGGRVSVRVAARGPHPKVEGSRTVVLEVADNGCGMDEATLERACEPFFSTKFRGRGLGLSAVQGIVKAHGGALEITSRPDDGAVVRVVLPALEASVPDAPASAPPKAAKGERILIVDDEPAVARVAARSLQMFGYSTCIAGGGREALSVVGASGPTIDAVLLDRTMPDLSGEETLALLREQAPEIAVVLTSGYDEAESLIAAGRSTPDGFLRKPFTPAEVASAIAAALEATRDRRGVSRS